MEEERKTKRVNLFIIVAILAVALLFFVSIVEIVVINSKNKQIREQQSQIEDLNHSLEYFENQPKNNDDKYDIVGGEE